MTRRCGWVPPRGMRVIPTASIPARRYATPAELSTTVGRVQPALFTPPAPAESVTMTILGDPVPQGSKQGFVPTYKNGDPVRVAGGRILCNIVDDNAARLRPWRARIKAEAARAMTGRAPLAGPLLVYATFTRRKPAAAPKRRRTWPETYPDVDKLLRALLDGLDDGGVYGDDGQVVAALAVKCYPGEASTAEPWESPLPEPGVHVIIKRLAWTPGEQPSP